jgi:hypothetical protein
VRAPLCACHVLLLLLLLSAAAAAATEFDAP